MPADGHISDSHESVEAMLPDSLHTLVCMCAWCRRYKSGDEWLPMQPHFPSPITHCICPECVEKHMGELEFSSKCDT